ncbi:MAG: DUF6457 domain-containing protein [Leifsonia sp.]|uniref:DUF6457 domain-containing protein n=1 Tax=Leifsonia sp. TaxID=1870902 RepID=UPI003F80EA28
MRSSGCGCGLRSTRCVSVPCSPSSPCDPSMTRTVSALTSPAAPLSAFVVGYAAGRAGTGSFDAASALVPITRAMDLANDHHGSA